MKGFLLTIRTAKLVKWSQIQLTWSKFPLLLCSVVVLHPRSLQSFTAVIGKVIIVKNKQVPNTLSPYFLTVDMLSAQFETLGKRGIGTQ